MEIKQRKKNAQCANQQLTLGIQMDSSQEFPKRLKETEYPFVRSAQSVSVLLKQDMMTIFISCKPEAHADSLSFNKSGIAYIPAEKKQYYMAITPLFCIARSMLSNFIEFPITCQVACSWDFLIKKNNRTEEIGYYSHRPDTDGLLKAAKDCIQDRPLFKLSKAAKFNGAGIIKDDCLIVSETTAKYHTYENGPTGIRLKLHRPSQDFRRIHQFARVLDMHNRRA